MSKQVIGLESSSLMPLVAIAPLSEDCYRTIWGELFDCSFLIHQDSLDELRRIFHFPIHTFFSDPITRIEKLRELPLPSRLTIKGLAIKLLLDGQAGGWIANKNSRVQTFFFSDVIDNMEDSITDPQGFSDILVARMKAKIDRFHHLITPQDNILIIDLKNALPYWGYHNVSTDYLEEDRKLAIEVREDCVPVDTFISQPPAVRRDAFHYHMLMHESVDLILVGDANFEANICRCNLCNRRPTKLRILTNKRRNALLNL